MRLLKEMQEQERFSQTESGIIQYIMEHPREIPDLSIRDLSERTYTSPAAIFRLCQKLKLKGYTEFKIKLISEMARVNPGEGRIVRRPITDKDRPDDVIRKMAALEIEAIEETRNEIDLMQLERVVDWLDEAKDIDFYAFDANYCIAQLAAYNLWQIKKHPVVSFAMNSQLAQALNSDKEHVAIILSRSGENRRLIAIAKILKKRGVKTILFTVKKGSTLSHFADEFMYVANTADYLDMGGFIFSAGVKYYLDTLFGLLLARHYDEMTAFYDSFEDVLGRMDDPHRLW